MNAHAIKPELPEPFPVMRETWTCPKTGLIVPKDPVKNLAWRANLLQLAEQDEGFRRDMYTACAQSVIFWVNAFAFTFRVRETDEAGKPRQAMSQEIPFVTWEIQDQHLLAIDHAIENSYDLLTDKTRDMGASWNHIAVFHHRWLFRPNQLFLEISRVEDDVDGSNNPKCLFVKHDFINKWLPAWMRPPGVLPGEKHRTKLHLPNPLNESRIDGESSNKAAASGDRRTAVLLDEFAKQDNAEKIKTSTYEVGPRMVNSTPFGPGTTYSKWRKSSTIKVFVLPWWEHPEKGRGRYVVQDEMTGKWKIRSPAYDNVAERMSPQEIAQEWDMDHIGSGDTFFEDHVIEQHRRLFGQRKFTSRVIKLNDAIPNSEVYDYIKRRPKGTVRILPTPKKTGGPLRIWAPLIENRLNQKYDYVIGADISKGQGASNSVLAVRCVQTNEIVAEWADANTPPYEMTRIAVALAIWVGGRRGLPFMIWEANGPGWDFGRMMVHQFAYPFYYRDKSVELVTDKRSKRYGWHSSRSKKEILLGILRRHYAHGGIIHYSDEALEEALSYVYYESGGLGPASLREESTEARKTHGDRIIATALTFAEEMGITTPENKTERVPSNSPGGRALAKKRAKKRQTGFPRKFSFRA